MPDLGVLKILKKLLMENATIRNLSMDDRIHISPPDSCDGALISLELEEIWSSALEPLMRVRVKTSVHGDQGSFGKMHLGQALKETWNGRVLDLENGRKGMVKLAGVVMNFPSDKMPNRSLDQYYEVLVR